MTPEDRVMAEAVVRRLCERARICGIDFGFPLTLRFEHTEPGPKPWLPGQVYPNLESRWTVFEERPGTFPLDEEDLPDRSTDEQFTLLCSLRHRTIERAELGQEAPHLILTFEDGTVLFLNGNNLNDECWTIGVTDGDPKELWLVVAMYGRDFAIDAPPGFESERGDKIGDILRERRLAKLADSTSSERRRTRVGATLLLTTGIGFLALHYYGLRHNFYDYLTGQNFYDLLMAGFSSWMVGFSGPVFLIVGLWAIIRARPFARDTAWEWGLVVGAAGALGLINACTPALWWPWA